MGSARGGGMLPNLSLLSVQTVPTGDTFKDLTLKLKNKLGIKESVLKTFIKTIAGTGNSKSEKKIKDRMKVAYLLLRGTKNWPDWDDFWALLMEKRAEQKSTGASLQMPLDVFDDDDAGEAGLLAPTGAKKAKGSSVDKWSKSDIGSVILKFFLSYLLGNA